MMPEWRLFEIDTVSLRVCQARKKMNSQRCSRENWKGLKKLTKFAQNTRFSRLNPVMCKLQDQPPEHLKEKSWKISNRFSRLEVPLTRESQTEPRKSLCTPWDWTFHQQTSHQPKPWKAWNSKYPPMSRQWVAKNLCDGLAVRACDWFYPWLSRQNRATSFFFEILTIFIKTKYFPKTTKNTQKYFFDWSTKIKHVKTHLNKYNHTNEYSIHWTLACVLCENIKDEIVLSLMWSFNDQFNQDINN